jgi:hypothetical protein
MLEPLQVDKTAWHQFQQLSLSFVLKDNTLVNLLTYSLSLKLFLSYWENYKLMNWHGTNFNNFKSFLELEDIMPIIFLLSETIFVILGKLQVDELAWHQFQQLKVFLGA